MNFIDCNRLKNGGHIYTAILSDDLVREMTENWIKQAVIGLNLCPFAKSVYVKQQIRYQISKARDIENLLCDLRAELQFVAQEDPEKCETSLLIHPYVLADFLEFNDFLSLADRLVAQLELSGTLQIASFHPQYQFADTAPDAIENFTNRSPYPTLHILREESIDRAVEAFPDAAAIFEKNIQTMRRLGLSGWNKLLQKKS